MQTEGGDVFDGPKSSMVLVLVLCGLPSLPKS